MDITDIPTSKSNVGQLLLEALENSWRKYLKELKRFRDEFSKEAVHDLRVATRRMMAVFQLLNSIAPRPRLQKVSRLLKEQLDEFDDLRDTQVILAEISEAIQKFPELQLFQKRQRRQENKLFRSVRKKIEKFSTKELARRIRKIHDAMQSEEGENLVSDILQAADDAYMIAQKRLARVDLARPVTIHRVRIAFKTFRYMVEVIFRLVKDFPENNLKSMQDYQSLMGDVQDAEVFLQTFDDFSENGSFSDPEAIHDYYEHRHAEAISAYANDKNQMHNFWRSAPDQLFPWEKPE